MRLIEQNAQRTAEEALGQIRWLHPDYDPHDQAPTKTTVSVEQQQAEASPVVSTTASKSVQKIIPEQVRAIKMLDELHQHSNRHGFLST